MDSPPEDTFHWRMYNYVVGRFLQNREFKRIPNMQVRGTCGGQGNAGGIDMMNAILCYLYGFTFPGFTSPAGFYTGARVELGNSAGAWDGAVGIHLAACPKKLGSLFLTDTIGNSGLDHTANILKDEQLAVKWTNTRTGVPDDKQALMKQLLIEDYIPITTVEEAGKAIQNHNMVFGGTNLIPSGKRDANGYSAVRSAGGHWTFFGDVRWKSNGRVEGLLYYNSWGINWGTGPSYPSDMPTGAVWVSADEAQTMIAQRDYYTYVRPMGLIYAPRT